MRSIIAPVKNVAALSAAYEDLAGRDSGVPGMGLVYGYTGAGKTTTVCWQMNRCNAIYVRATAAWTQSAMLGRIMSELGSEPLFRGGAAMVEYISNAMNLQARPLFVDEADYLVGDLRMLETLRDIHDLSSQPVMLIGMDGIQKRITSRKQLERRISHWVEFKPADLEDAHILARSVCEVPVSDGLLCHLHTEAKGSMGLMVVGLSRIEGRARANGWAEATEDLWDGKRLFLGHNVR